LNICYGTKKLEHYLGSTVATVEYMFRYKC